jgi:sulfide dehydrogenase cytochrome subunit
LLLGGWLVVAGVHAGDASSELIALVCNGCHGYDGVSQGAVPSLKGLPADYMVEAMREFRAERRPATIMGRIARGYSEAEIAGVARYFSSLR